jgi:murein DD-endopeptidase MepM/ murein hydrolase activator NlpD
VVRFCKAAKVRNLVAAALVAGWAMGGSPALADSRSEEFAYGSGQQTGPFDRAFDDLIHESLVRNSQSMQSATLVAPVSAAANGQALLPKSGSPAVVRIYAGQWSSMQVQDQAIGAHITVSRAADAVGAAVDITRPTGPHTGTKAGTGAIKFATMPNGLPVSSRSLTSSFGMRRHPTLGGHRMHSGIDLAAPMGSPIVATSDGVVSTAGWAGGYGLAVGLDHGGGLQTRFGHMSQVAVVPGQQVRRGQVIGYVGSTGRSTGPHLHYEMRVNGQAVNPISPNRK